MFLAILNCKTVDSVNAPRADVGALVGSWEQHAVCFFLICQSPHKLVRTIGQLGKWDWLILFMVSDHLTGLWPIRKMKVSACCSHDSARAPVFAPVALADSSVLTGGNRSDLSGDSADGHVTNMMFSI